MTNEQLIEKARKGDATAKDELFERNFKYIHWVAHQFSSLPIEYEDRVSACSLGMVKAFDNFDANKGVKFTTFAYLVMKGEVLKQLREYNRVKRVETISLETPVARETSVTLGDTISFEDQDLQSLEDRLLVNELISDCHEKEILKLLSVGMTQKEIGVLKGISQQQVSRRYRKGIAQIRQAVTV